VIGALFKNSAWILLSQTIIKGISFAYTIFLAGKLGVDGFGLYSVALAYFSLFASFSDIGLSRYLIREGAKDHNELNRLLTTTILLRLVLVLILLFGALILLRNFDPDPFRLHLSMLAMLAVIPQAIALTFDGALIAIQKIKLSSLGVLLLSLLTTALGFYFVNNGYGETGALSALIVAEILYAIIMCYLLIKSGVHFPYTHGLFHNLKNIFLGSIPYGILGVMGLIYFKVDTLLLSYLRGSYETGLYSAAYRFLEALVFIPSAVATAAFPVLSRLHEVDNSQVKKIYLSSVKALGGLSIIITLGYIFLLPYLITYFLPEYQDSVQVIQILALTIPFMFIHVPAAVVLLTSDKFLKPVIILSLLTVGFNVIANLLLIPTYGIYAAAWITVASEILSFTVFFLLLYKRLLRHA